MICEVGKKYFAWERRDPDALHAVYTHTHTISLFPAMGKSPRLSGPSFPDSKVKGLNWTSRRPARKTATQGQ